VGAIEDPLQPQGLAARADYCLGGSFDAWWWGRLFDSSFAFE
jgi:hypothetical protein